MSSSAKRWQNMASDSIGKIVGSESHVRYTCQVFTQGEVAAPPEPLGYAFGNFVRVPLRASSELAADVAFLQQLPGTDTAPSGMVRDEPRRAQAPKRKSPGFWAIGLIYDTILVNPAFGTLGPRLSTDTQMELFSPDYISERAVLVSILLLGTMALCGHDEVRQVSHGVPALALDLGAEVWALDDDLIRAFHFFADNGAPGGSHPYLHMGYLSHALALDNSLLPVAMLRTIERLEALFPENSPVLSIVKRNFAWKMKVQSAR
jgi:hypothetical protein